MLRIGILGAGSHSSEVHGVALKMLKDARPDRFEIASVCDLDEERAKAFQGRFGADQTYTDLEAMLAGQRLDALMAVTPIKHTETIVSRLLTQGIPMLIEKPPGETAAATQRLSELANRHSVQHMVSWNRRFAPALVRARDWIAESPDRRPLMVLGRMLRHRRLEADFVMGTGVHVIDAILSVMGRPKRVESAATATGKEGVSFVRAAMEFDDGRQAACMIAPDAGVLEETYEIVGSEYSIRVDALKGSLAIYSAGEAPITWQVDPDAVAVEANGTLVEMEAFLHALEGEGPWLPTLEDSVASMATAEAIARGGVTTF